MPLYDINSQFRTSSLHRLEWAGINVVTTLAEMYSEVMVAAEITLDEHLQQRLACSETSTERFDIVIGQWISHSLPTWKSLLDVLKELNLSTLCLQIEEYFNTNGMMQQC